MQLEHSFFVGIQDVGANNEITNKALLEAFTNITNLQGKLAGQGTNDKTSSHLSPEIMDVYGCEPEHQNFPDFKFGKVRKPETSFLSSQTFTIHKAMIDCNHHVHNPAYLDLVAEGLPEGLDTKNLASPRKKDCSVSSA